MAAAERNIATARRSKRDSGAPSRHVRHRAAAVVPGGCQGQ